MIDAIAAAESVDDLVALAAGSRRQAFALLDGGDSAARLTRTIADLNDALTTRLLALLHARYGLADIPFAWISLGSEGRREQTVHTDQDNAIVFASRQPDAARARLLAFADAANTALDRCGFPLCRGNIMARNPHWCLTLEQWQERFASWIDTGNPQALLHAAIFFDFRGLWGALPLAQQLRGWLTDYIAPRPLFLRQMSENALANRTPIGWLGHWRLDRDGPGVGTFDIKVNGAGLFTDGARILALSRGIDQTETVERLAAWPRTEYERREARSWAEAFLLLQNFRLRRQAEGHRAGLPMDNRIAPGKLSAFDQRQLRACFAVANTLRRHLVVEFGLGV